MKKILSVAIISCILLGTAGCKKDDDFLYTPPTTFLSNDQVFSDPVLALSVLGDLYNRQVDFSGLDNGWASFADFSESFPSENGSAYIVQRTGWNYDQWALDWNGSYTYIRELNLFLERDSASKALKDVDKNLFYAEARFLRANFYFEMVKRFGGVPLITHSLTYDYSGDPKYLQLPRAKESEIYDFVISEAEAIKNELPDDAATKSRASKGAALAMEARAALYAGSIAKYGFRTPAVSLPGGEVGISADKANGYYTIALRAAQEIINSGKYALYKNITSDLSENFANLFLDKNSSESIFIEDFKVASGKTHGFTTNDQPYSLSEEGGDAGRLNPSLNLVEQFELLNNTFAPLATVDNSGNPIYYNNQTDIFAGRDARLMGTVIVPGSGFKNGTVDIWAGYMLGNGTIITSDQAGHKQKLPNGQEVQVVGEDGPINGLEFRTQTGFYIRKYLDPTIGAGRRGTGSGVAFIRYRYAEVLLNAAEAAFELGQNGVAADYMNQVRARAGLTIPLSAGDITFDRIVHERRVELAFEGHIFYDMKRWRLAHIVWDGAPTTLANLRSNIGSATQRSTQPWGLWPYKMYNPGNPNDGKWLYKEVLPALVTGTNRFLMGNYYSQINNDVIAHNPAIVRQPNQ